MIVGELTEQHVGWQIKVGRARSDSEFCDSRTFTLKALRTWTYEGVTTVGLLDPTDARGNVRGTERHYDPATPCKLIRPVSAKAKRLAREVRP